MLKNKWYSPLPNTALIQLARLTDGDRKFIELCRGDPNLFSLPIDNRSQN